ncbi:MAG TPA: folylpolyglutamate synthase/dihydrofolate synthase family protein [Caldisericia bacterium]|nr:folylpolyglutamate synthase/dihydrofolate synthase family protein [Caldisericia bacterium]
MNIIDQINNYPRFSQHIGLERIKRLLDTLELSYAPFPYIHIAGTKGKGSTAVFFANILKEAGYKTGLFTSPHLQSINERICIDLHAINLDRLSELYEIIHQILQDLKMFDVSYFELITAIALLEFKLQKVDIVILETGMGGRLDATNALSNPILTVLTTIGLDHLDRLGPDLASIAREKAAIIKPSAAVLSAPQNALVEKIIQEKANEKQVHHYSIYRDYQISSYPAKCFNKEQFDVLSYITGIPYTDIQISLLGKHQALNACLALAGSELLTKKGFIIRENHIREGLNKSAWPGRFEQVKVNGKLLIMDGAHNPDSTQALCETLQERFPDKKVRIVFSTLYNKLFDQNLINLSPVAQSFYFTQITDHAAIDPEELLEWTKQHYPDLPSYSYPDQWSCFIKALEATDPNKELLCVTGSLYYIGWLRSKLALPFYLQNGKELLEVKL